jgi:hypothetical protein
VPGLIRYPIHVTELPSLSMKLVDHEVCHCNRAPGSTTTASPIAVAYAVEAAGNIPPAVWAGTGVGGV